MILLLSHLLFLFYLPFPHFLYHFLLLRLQLTLIIGRCHPQLITLELECCFPLPPGSCRAPGSWASTTPGSQAERVRNAKNTARWIHWHPNTSQGTGGLGAFGKSEWDPSKKSHRRLQASRSFSLHMQNGFHKLVHINLGNACYEHGIEFLDLITTCRRSKPRWREAQKVQWRIVTKSLEDNRTTSSEFFPVPTIIM